MIVVTNNDRMGKNILTLRQKHNLSQKAFAQMVGLSNDSLNAIEQYNQFEIDAWIIDNICTYFKVNVSVLMEDLL